MTEKPIIGITMGDPFGNGPEITVQVLADRALYQRCRPLVVGDYVCMDYALKVAKQLWGIELSLHVISSPEEAWFTFGTIDLIDLSLIPESALPAKQDGLVPPPFGVGACAMGGEASFRYIVTVIRLALEHKINATVTNAISKEAINMAGHSFSGHTEIYAHYTGASHYAMLLAHEELRVVHVSTHVSLRRACDLVKRDRVLECIRLAHQSCTALGIANPKVGVAGLNPHCGENGMFGTEEQEEIQPAIDAALSEGINIPDKKPVPPDTVFSKALGGWYDIVVVMYHDQGHIPLKVKGFVYDKTKKCWGAVAGVNVTLGLPIIRASVDHGTGYGHAGSGRANPVSLANAIDYAIRLASGCDKIQSDKKEGYL